MQTSIQFTAQDIVGESIIWAAQEQALYWVDIGGRRIHRLEPESGQHDAWQAPDFPTSIGLRAKGGFILGLSRELCFWRPGGAFEPFVIPEPDLPNNRLNEGCVAPDGSFWVSTMENNLHPDGSPRDMTGKSGAIYRIDVHGTVMQLTPREYGITNTMGWTTDNRFLFADTLENEIYSFAYDPQTKRLSDRRTIVQGFGRGLPDGSCMDADDTLWNCRVVGGASVARFTSQGELLALVELPVSWPTSCTFGGPDLTTLYVTSARFTMTPHHLAAHPVEGSLIAVADAGLGIPEPKFAG
ncbi:sugar lactone lactonase YvrE [Pararhizobium capsulatum DSM 1112]|uniref:Sugar lactone lactonase YvrE n=1 Tax=Pararhizobium capsulatum DSM 1112 TaxID=1121113 RepID=A0ABU0BYL7_9HYPH|nr:SMP-30/gluconolactonase/LRE family protein [Pararhizobium capsulatum]MDQ0323027.1 sugar lactone lactonase YvrE [Pararhizobium capsulatum DSM 1112]